MRFLFECVTCRSSADPSGTNPPAELDSRLLSPVKQNPSPPAADPYRMIRRKKRHLSSRQAKVAAAVWKPSLYAISEDNDEADIITAPVKVKVIKAESVNKAVAAGAAAAAAVSRRSSGKRCSAAVSKGTNIRGDDELPMVVPAFSPTPFVF